MCTCCSRSVLVESYGAFSGTCECRLFLHCTKLIMANILYQKYSNLITDSNDLDKHYFAATVTKFRLIN